MQKVAKEEANRSSVSFNKRDERGGRGRTLVTTEPLCHSFTEVLMKMLLEVASRVYYLPGLNGSFSLPTSPVENRNQVSIKLLNESPGGPVQDDVPMLVTVCLKRVDTLRLVPLRITAASCSSSVPVPIEATIAEEALLACYCSPPVLRQIFACFLDIFMAVFPWMRSTALRENAAA